MVINWYGEGCFKIQSGELSVLTDPFSAEGGSASGGGYSDIGLGLQPPRSKTNAVLKTISEYPPAYAALGPGTIVGPGEYDFSGMKILGWPLNEVKNGKAENKTLKTAYRLTMEEMHLGFLGHLAKMPSPEIIEELGQIDILFVPAGGEPFIEQERTVQLIKQIAPKIVIASFFKIPGLKRKAADVKEFLKELDKKSEPEEKLVLKKKDLPAQLTAVVLKI